MSKAILVVLLLMSQAFATTIHRHNEQPLNYDFQSKIFGDEVETGHLTVKVEKVYFPDGCQKKKLEQAFKLMERVLNSEEFKQKVIGYVAKFSDKREYTGSNGLSNEQVYEHLMTGQEISMMDTEGEVNLYVTKYHRFWSRVIAWTNPRTDNFIHVNWRFYKRFSVDEMVSNLVHEWVHLMGYFHVSQNDSDSVPYGVGRIAGEVAKNLMEQDEQNLLAANN